MYESCKIYFNELQMKVFRSAATCRIHCKPVTFEDRRQTPPASDGPLSVELPQRQLHVEQWDSSHHQHDAVRHQECSCNHKTA